MAAGRQMLDMNLNMSEEEEVQSEKQNESHENTQPQRPKKRGYHRHTPYQIQKLDAFFEECPHPNKKQRMELGEEIGMEALKVKFWFQNKRTQLKFKDERVEITNLRAEIEKLREENIKCREALRGACCPSCGCMVAIGDVSFDDHLLRMENARLRQEVDRISAIAAMYVGNPLANSCDAPSSSLAPCSNHVGAAAVSKLTFEQWQGKT